MPPRLWVCLFAFCFLLLLCSGRLGPLEQDACSTSSSSSSDVVLVTHIRFSASVCASSAIADTVSLQSSTIFSLSRSTSPLSAAPLLLWFGHICRYFVREAIDRDRGAREPPCRGEAGVGAGVGVGVGEGGPQGSGRPARLDPRRPSRRGSTPLRTNRRCGRRGLRQEQTNRGRTRGGG